MLLLLRLQLVMLLLLQIVQFNPHVSKWPVVNIVAVVAAAVSLLLLLIMLLMLMLLLLQMQFKKTITQILKGGVVADTADFVVAVVVNAATVALVAKQQFDL